MKRFLGMAICLALLLSACGGETTTPSPSTPVSVQPQQGQVTMSMINIGKGDCLLLTLPDGYYLVDTGKEEDYPIILRALRQKGVTQLKGIFLTHGHKDHMGSLQALLQVFPVETIYTAGADSVTFQGQNVPTMLQEAGVGMTSLTVGQELLLGDVKVTVLSPKQESQQEENDNSLVLKLTFGQTSYLLMGDATQSIEAELLEEQADLKADVLKAGHHGKDDASSDAFLEAVSPKYAAVTGNEQEDDESPGKETMQRMQQRGIEVTISEGDFLTADYISDGTTVTFQETAEQQGEAAAGVSFALVDRDSEMVILQNNTGSEIDISGWSILSEYGGDVFVFPKGTVIGAGATVSVASGKNPPPADFTWAQENMWKEKQKDDAVLYDANGREAARDEHINIKK